MTEFLCPKPFLAASLLLASCAARGDRPADPPQPSRVREAACAGRLIDLPARPLLIARIADAGIETRDSTILRPNGELINGGQLAGRLDPSGCFHDARGVRVARWTEDGRLIEDGPPHHVLLAIRLREGRLELSFDDSVEHVWTIEHDRILRNGAPYATVTGPADANTAELALRVLLLPDLARNARAKLVE